ncbi:hypothetical protein C8Q76DRAFT_698616 [Earliella scabrosa]|nr:hypothetical protein C8Q76DRAFT_698616 [Earliella scabrosa]
MRLDGSTEGMRWASPLEVVWSNVANWRVAKGCIPGRVPRRRARDGGEVDMVFRVASRHRLVRREWRRHESRFHRERTRGRVGTKEWVQGASNSVVRHSFKSRFKHQARTDLLQQILPLRRTLAPAMPSSTRLMLLSSILVAATYYVAYVAVLAMWDRFEEQFSAVTTVGRAHGVAHAQDAYANTTVSFISLPMSSEAYVCMASNVDDVLSTLLVPAPALALFLELGDLHLNMCDFPGTMAVTFTDGADLKMFAALLEGAMTVNPGQSESLTSCERVRSGRYFVKRRVDVLDVCAARLLTPALDLHDLKPQDPARSPAVSPECLSFGQSVIPRTRDEAP